MKVGDRVRNIYSGKTGVILDVWDGKYSVDYYEGEQYNPYRITVTFDNSTEGVTGKGTVVQKMEHLELESASLG